MTLFLCQITSQQTKDAYAINLMDSDMVNGSLKKVSNIRPNRIFTAYEHIVLYKIGSIHANKLQQVRDKIIELLDQ
ncbi:hypothetical protein WJR50_27060 [Catalinimonas sp. 4WD22]|uniref:hypothetical protein n=1 Tax=Catalinimonas locisalis TaxID=3133978 RepID=UPI003100E34E